MDRAEQYRQIVKNVLSACRADYPGEEGVELEMVSDDAAGHYALEFVGWEGWKRVHGSYIHVDVRDGKIWIQHDGTHDGIVDELLELGVPTEHIVLAWQHPFKRQFTEFAVG